MLLSAVSVLVVTQSSSEIPEGLMNNPVLYFIMGQGIREEVDLTSRHDILLFVSSVQETNSCT